MTLLPLAALASTALAPAAHATATANPSTDPSAPSTTDVTQTVEAVAATTVDVFSIAWRAGLGTLVGIALAFVGVVVLRALGRRQTMYAEVSRYTRTALYALGGLIGAYLGVQVAIVSVVTPAANEWTDHLDQEEHGNSDGDNRDRRVSPPDGEDSYDDVEHHDDNSEDA